MKKLTLSVAICGMLLATSCKKEETVTETSPDGVTTVTTTTTENTVDLELSEKAKADLDAAEVKLAEAKAKGDKESERLAQVAVNNAKSAWEATKQGISTAGKKINTEASEANENLKESAAKAKADLKEGYNNTLEKAKAK